MEGRSDDTGGGQEWKVGVMPLTAARNLASPPAVLATGSLGASLAGQQESLGGGVE